MTYAIIVTGGRGYKNAECVGENLGRLEIGVLIHGAADGADTLAHLERTGNYLAIPVPAWWRKQDPKTGTHWTDYSAGPIRNGVMLDIQRAFVDAYGWVPLVLLFPGGSGTADMKRQAVARGVEVREAE